MKRPMLVSGTVMLLSCAVFTIYGTVAAISLLVLSASVFVLYLIKPLGLRKKLVIPTICISIILSSLSFICYNEAKVKPVLDYAGYESHITGKVIDVPTAISDTTLKFTVKTHTIDENRFTTKITVYTSKEIGESIEPFDFISLEDAFISVELNESNDININSFSDNTVLEADAQSVDVHYSCEKTPYYYCLKLRQILCEQADKYLLENESGLLLGMLFGDKAQLDYETTANFRNAGISHLLAVSGLHTSLWCGLIIAVLKLLQIKEKTRNLICILFLGGFCIISAFTPSVLRASLMTLVMLSAPFFSRRQDSLNSLGLAVAMLLLNNPYIILSLSFQLSASATLGVIFSQHAVRKITFPIKESKSNVFKRFANYLCESVAVSFFAGLFTLPFSTIYFGVFSLVAPFANLVCVKPAFWSMLSGFFSTLFSFIPLEPLKPVVIFLFDITSFLLNGVMALADFCAGFKFSTIPVYKEALILSAIILSFFFLFRWLFRNKKAAIKIIAVFCSACAITSFILPLTPKHGTEITVYDVGIGLNFSLRSGLDLCYFNCGGDKTDADISDICVATSQTLNLLYISRYGKCNTYSEDMLMHSPETTVTTDYVKSAFLRSDITLPKNTIIADEIKYRLNNKINIQTFNTYRNNYVIIDAYSQKILAFSGSEKKLSELFDSIGTPDLLILYGDLPEKLPKKVGTLIISKDSTLITDTNAIKLKQFCDKYLTTCEKGDISWHF